MECEFKIQIIEVVYKCNECKNGSMKRTGIIKAKKVGGLEYEHKCNNCGRSAFLDKKYPYDRRDKKQTY